MLIIRRHCYYTIYPPHCTKTFSQFMSGCFVCDISGVQYHGTYKLAGCFRLYYGVLCSKLTVFPHGFLNYWKYCSIVYCANIALTPNLSGSIVSWVVPCLLTEKSIFMGNSQRVRYVVGEAILLYVYAIPKFL